ncbi:MAG: hypothetical protein KIT16_17915 [Rhodospirillaceae bacterium]|nr:hypothetical protein [Rhodospirillaceae bacterium]
MNLSPSPFRAALAGAIFAIAAGASAATASAQGISPNPGTGTGNGDRITANIVARELRAMGLPAEINTDNRGMPRVSTTIDNYKWAIFFYGCQREGEVGDRQCLSIQFFSGYTMTNPVSSITMNKWNTENRYARGYAFANNRGETGARIEVDASFGGTGADPAKMFRVYFNIMRHQTKEFRKLINFN